MVGVLQQDYIRAARAQGLSGNVFQALMTRSLDEPFTLYGLIAQSIETDDERSYVVFRLNRSAKFSDGAPITAAASPAGGAAAKRRAASST